MQNLSIKGNPMKIIDCIQGTEEWHLARLGKATASHFSDCVAGGQGKTRKTYMLQLLAERLTGEPTEGFSNAAMQHGTDTEPLAREYYEQVNGCTVDQVGFIERDEWVGASPDGLIGDKGLVEIKCPNSTTHIRYIMDGKVPTTYRKQIQGQLWVCEREWCDFVSYDPRVKSRPYFCERVERDDKFIKELAIGVTMFVTDLKEMIDSFNPTF